MLRAAKNQLIGLLSLLLLSACGPSPSLTDSDRDHDRSTATLNASGFDAERMQELTRRLQAGEFPNIHAVLVEQDARRVYEVYLAGQDQSWGVDVGFRRFDAWSLHDVRAVSKSVTSLLLGAALGDDFEAALARPIIEFFPQMKGDIAAGVERVTLHHVLTMTAGFDWNEMDVSYSSLTNDARRLYFAADPVRYALGKPLRHEPGERWYYNGGMTMVLAAVVEQVSGREFLDFAYETLAAPLDISRAEVEWMGLGIWRARPSLPGAGSGLRTTARSLAKIGNLVRDGGRWGERQLVPEAWIEQSTRRHTEQSTAHWSFGGIYGYGYQWWHGEFRGEYGNFSAISAVGLGGQRLFILPARDLVVVVFAGNYDTGLYRVSERLLAEIIAAAPQVGYSGVISISTLSEKLANSCLMSRVL